jgi:hypothetical protein
MPPSQSVRKYATIWSAISAAPMTTPVKVRVHKNNMDTLIQGVLKEKSRETAVLARYHMPRAGKLSIDRGSPDDKDMCIVTFSLPVDGRKI